MNSKNIAAAIIRDVFGFNKRSKTLHKELSSVLDAHAEYVLNEHKRTHICTPLLSVSERDKKIVDDLIRGNIEHHRYCLIATGESDDKTSA